MLDSEKAAARVLLIGLEPGQELGEHEVEEHALVLVLEGSAELEAGGQSLQADAMTLVGFEPEERRPISSSGGTRLLLFLAPWPGLFLAPWPDLGTSGATSARPPRPAKPCGSNASAPPGRSGADTSGTSRGPSGT